MKTYALIYRNLFYCGGCGRSNCRLKDCCLVRGMVTGWIAGSAILDNPAFLCEYQERFGMEPVDADRDTADESMSRCLKEGYSVVRA
jgi:hypothetical protein